MKSSTDSFEEIKQNLQDYVHRMREIRSLSAPAVDDLHSADEYVKRLSENFQMIGCLAEKNRQVISEIIMPMIDSEKPLSGEELREIIAFNDSLMNIYEHDNMDLPILLLVSKRLLKEAYISKDADFIVRQLDEMIVACITAVVENRRIITRPDIVGDLRRQGLDALDRMLEYLEPERFHELSEDSRKLIMIDSRFGDGLYISMLPLTAEERRTRYARLLQSLSFSSDPGLTEQMHDYDWRYHIYRIYQYLSSADEFSNAVENTPDELEMIADYGEKLEALWLSDRTYFSELDNYGYTHMNVSRNLMHAGRMSMEKYRKTLVELYDDRSVNAHTMDDIVNNVAIPRDYAASFAGCVMDEYSRDTLTRMYRETLDYIFVMPKEGTFYELMDYFAPLVFDFVEIPGRITFEEFVLAAFAAIHPPTYIHSHMVARIAQCLCGHLLQVDPDRMIGVWGMASVKEVMARRDELLDFVYHAALCHDFGKIIVIDTVCQYGRKILDSEFDILKQHPKLGADMLAKYNSTRSYADIARGHHLWYNGKKGYPEDFAVSESPLKPVIDIVACADCMDAATDSIGRSYSTGKSLSEYCEEVHEGAGERYAPWLAELLWDEATHKDLEYLLKIGRRNLYAETFHLLRDVHAKGTG